MNCHLRITIAFWLFECYLLINIYVWLFDWNLLMTIAVWWFNCYILRTTSFFSRPTAGFESSPCGGHPRFSWSYSQTSSMTIYWKILFHDDEPLILLLSLWVVTIKEKYWIPRADSKKFLQKRAVLESKFKKTPSEIVVFCKSLHDSAKCSFSIKTK